MKDEIIVSKDIRERISKDIITDSILIDLQNLLERGLEFAIVTDPQGKIQFYSEKYKHLKELTGHRSINFKNIMNLFPQLSKQDLEEIKRRTGDQNFIGYKDTIRNRVTGDKSPINVYWGQKKNFIGEALSKVKTYSLTCLIRSYQFFPEEEKVEDISKNIQKVYLDLEGTILEYTQSVPYMLDHTDLQGQHFDSLGREMTNRDTYRQIAKKLKAGAKEVRKRGTLFKRNGEAISVNLIYRLGKTKKTQKYYIAVGIGYANPIKR